MFNPERLVLESRAQSTVQTGQEVIEMTLILGRVFYIYLNAGSGVEMKAFRRRSYCTGSTVLYRANVAVKAADVAYLRWHRKVEIKSAKIFYAVLKKKRKKRAKT